jgi:hypothetical protein
MGGFTMQHCIADRGRNKQGATEGLLSQVKWMKSYLKRTSEQHVRFMRQTMNCQTNQRLVTSREPATCTASETSRDRPRHKRDSRDFPTREEDYVSASASALLCRQNTVRLLLRMELLLRRHHHIHHQVESHSPLFMRKESLLRRR